jgi:hypothetical protein
MVPVGGQPIVPISFPEYVDVTIICDSTVLDAGFQSVFFRQAGPPNYNLTLRGCTFIRGNGTGNRPSIVNTYANSGILNIEDCTFVNNTGSSNLIELGTGKITGSTFSNNTPVTAVIMVGGGELNLTNTTFKDNAALAVVYTGAKGRIVGCKFVTKGSDMSSRDAPWPCPNGVEINNADVQFCCPEGTSGKCSPNPGSGYDRCPVDLPPATEIVQCT